jgi:exopolysaccharide biosynthesis WecB/TagA/CpsF family protein
MIHELSLRISKNQESLLDKISNSSNRKESLYLLYSEFCLRSKENLGYYNTIKNSDYLGVDGKGVIWALNAIEHFENHIKDGSAKKVKNNLLSFLIVYISNFFSALNFIFLKKRIQTTSKTELILGRDLTYSLLSLAEQKDLKTLIVGGGDLEVVKENIILKYPKIDLEHLSFPTDSIVMKDGLKFNQLNESNLFEFFPELILVLTKVVETKPDLILVGLGGTSGKQEFLINTLQKDEEIDFRLAAGIGAALDHLGGGKKQKEAPRWMQNYGLEFVWRILNQPYRIKRILDSVFGLIQLVTEEMLER